eukprot:scaffold7703_cov103-Isochrysis_galbana.AAC.1
MCNRLAPAAPAGHEGRQRHAGAVHRQSVGPQDHRRRQPAHGRALLKGGSRVPPQPQCGMRDGSAARRAREQHQFAQLGTQAGAQRRARTRPRGCRLVWGRGGKLGWGRWHRPRHRPTVEVAGWCGEGDFRMELRRGVHMDSQLPECFARHTGARRGRWRCNCGGTGGTGGSVARSIHIGVAGCGNGGDIGCGGMLGSGVSCGGVEKSGGGGEAAGCPGSYYGAAQRRGKRRRPRCSTFDVAVRLGGEYGRRRGWRRRLKRPEGHSGRGTHRHRYKVPRAGAQRRHTSRRGHAALQAVHNHSETAAHGVGAVVGARKATHARRPAMPAARRRVAVRRRCLLQPNLDAMPCRGSKSEHELPPVLRGEAAAFGAAAGGDGGRPGRPSGAGLALRPAGARIYSNPHPDRECVTTEARATQLRHVRAWPKPAEGEEAGRRGARECFGGLASGDGRAHGRADRAEHRGVCGCGQAEQPAQRVRVTRVTGERGKECQRGVRPLRDGAAAALTEPGRTGSASRLARRVGRSVCVAPALGLNDVDGDLQEPGVRSLD